MNNISKTNNASNGDIALVREWLEDTRLIPNRLTEEERDELAFELAHKIFGFIRDELAAEQTRADTVERDLSWARNEARAQMAMLREKLTEIKRVAHYRASEDRQRIIELTDAALDATEGKS